MCPRVIFHEKLNFSRIFIDLPPITPLPLKLNGILKIWDAIIHWWPSNTLTAVLSSSVFQLQLPKSYNIISKVRILKETCIINKGIINNVIHISFPIPDTKFPPKSLRLISFGIEVLISFYIVGTKPFPCPTPIIGVSKNLLFKNLF